MKTQYNKHIYTTSMKQVYIERVVYDRCVQSRIHAVKMRKLCVKFVKFKFINKDNNMCIIQYYYY